MRLNAQAARGFRLGGINDPLNVPLCTAEDLVTFGGRDTWKDETGLELRGRRQVQGVGANTIGAPLTASVFTFEPKLPAYDILNLRVGLRRAAWDVSLYLNNVTDERAFLSFDRERGVQARIGYLTNPPRTFGVATRFSF